MPKVNYSHCVINSLNIHRVTIDRKNFSGQAVSVITQRKKTQNSEFREFNQIE